jgi:hypothetical protein
MYASIPSHLKYFIPGSRIFPEPTLECLRLLVSHTLRFAFLESHLACSLPKHRNISSNTAIPINLMANYNSMVVEVSLE